jgi:hypothetical protein
MTLYDYLKCHIRYFCELLLYIQIYGNSINFIRDTLK